MCSGFSDWIPGRVTIRRNWEKHAEPFRNIGSYSGLTFVGWGARGMSSSGNGEGGMEVLAEQISSSTAACGKGLEKASLSMWASCGQKCFSLLGTGMGSVRSQVAWSQCGTHWR